MYDGRRKKLRKVLTFILIIVSILFVAPWLTSIAYGQTNDDSSQPDVRVEAAPPAAAPSATFFGKAIGSVTAGDLFYINSANDTRDISVNLYITNADELTPHLRYLILKVIVYSEGPDGQWREICLPDGSAYPDTFLTLRNSPVSFSLPGFARYKVAIESGCFYCLSAGVNGNKITPLFYLEIDYA